MGAQQKLGLQSAGEQPTTSRDKGQFRLRNGMPRRRSTVVTDEEGKLVVLKPETQAPRRDEESTWDETESES